MTQRVAPPSDERLLTIDQVGRMANLSPKTVRRDIQRKGLRVVYSGLFRHMRVRLSEARRYAGLD
jgi:hypothetical protein